jgi:hypothetical protein
VRVGDPSPANPALVGIAVGCLFALPAFLPFLWGMYSLLARGRAKSAMLFCLFLVPILLIVAYGWWWGRRGLEHDLPAWSAALLQGALLAVTAFGAVALILWIDANEPLGLLMSAFGQLVIASLLCALYARLLGVVVQWAVGRSAAAENVDAGATRRT